MSSQKVCLGFVGMQRGFKGFRRNSDAAVFMQVDRQDVASVVQPTAHVCTHIWGAKLAQFGESSLSLLVHFKGHTVARTLLQAWSQGWQYGRTRNFNLLPHLRQGAVSTTGRAQQ
eukprot:5309542-Amphidinium_carterae.1